MSQNKKAPNNKSIDVIIELLDKLVKFKDHSQNQFNPSQKDMITAISKSTEMLHEIFTLVDEFETSVGDPSYLRNDKFWGDK